LFFILFLDGLPMKMENELHEKMNDFLSSNIDGSDNPYTMNLSESNSPSAVNVDSNNTPSDGSSDVFNDILDITLGVSTNEKTKIR